MRFLRVFGVSVLRRVFLFLLGMCPLLALANTASDLANAGIDAAGILYVYTWGMGAVLSMWALGYAAGWAVKVIQAL